MPSPSRSPATRSTRARGRDPLRRRHLHEPESRAPRLPRHDAALLRRQGATSSTTDEAAAAVVCVDDEWGRVLRGASLGSTVEVASADAVTRDGDDRTHGVPLALAHDLDALTGRVNVTNALLALGQPPSCSASTTATPLARCRDVAARARPARGRRRRAPLRPGRLRAHARRAGAGCSSDVRRAAPGRTARGRLRVRRRPGPREASRDGPIASRLADVVVVTSDNPRSEDRRPPIIEEVLARCRRRRRGPCRDRSRAGDP